MTKNSFLSNKKIHRMIQDRYLYLMLLIPVVLVIVFNYVPMYGLIMAFEDFSVFDGFWGSEWVGLENFKKLFSQRGFLKNEESYNAELYRKSDVLPTEREITIEQAVIIQYTA